tara:strand:+ start:1311 stop:2342 length:1032 start_codon:yes stop_codon:yes gene_type:complete
MHSVIFKNDAVGDLVHSLGAITNIISSSKRVTIFLSNRSKNFSFLIQNQKVKIKILNYNLTLVEKIKLIFFFIKNKINTAYILSPKSFYYFLPLIFKKTKFYGICIDNVNNYKRPNKYLRNFLYKYEINDRSMNFRRPSTRTLQNRLTSSSDKKTEYNINIFPEKSDILKKYLPKNYIYFHFKKKIFDELNWSFNDFYSILNEFIKYSNYVVVTKDIEIDNNNKLFRENFSFYDFKKGEYNNKNRKILFFDNIEGINLFDTIKHSQKVVAFHGMMTNLGFLLKKPVLDLYHCKINSWSDYRRYRNSFYEFKPKYKDYDFIIPKKDIKKTLMKMKFSLEKCKTN